jgi:hypothetical protein
LYKIKRPTKLQEFVKIIESIHKSGQITPPEDFAETVLARLDRGRSISNLKKILLQPRCSSLKMSSIVTGRLSLQESIYIILATGLFYLFTGIVLVIGRKWMPDLYFNQWVGNQAVIAFLSTFYFFAVWGNLRRKNTQMLFLRGSSILYIALIIMNFSVTSRIFSLQMSVIFSFFLMGLGFLTSCLLLFSPTLSGTECENVS